MIKPFIMKKSFFVIAAVVTLSMIFSSCGSSGDTKASTTSSDKNVTGLVDVSYSSKDMSGDYIYSKTTKVKLTKSYKITEAGTYIFSGTIEDGQIVVDVGENDKVQLVLDGVDITCKTGPAILIESTDKAIITLAKDSKNTLSDGSTYTSTENQPWGTLFSYDDLTINGLGDLTVNGNSNNGIVSKDDLKITGGTINVTAKQNGIRGNNSVAICKGTITIKAGNDGIKATNTTKDGKGYVSIDGGKITISGTSSQGIDAATVGQITSGTVKITSDNEGIQGKQIYIKKGNLAITAKDDGLNATDGSDSGRMDQIQEDVYIKILGGSVAVTASGDGIDSNGDLYIEGGEVIVMGPENDGNGFLDYAGTGKITGGTVIAVGSSGMSQNFSDSSSQGSLLYNNKSGDKGTKIVVTDADGKEISNVTSTVKFTGILISSPEMKKGEKYTIKVGDDSETVEMTDTITTIGSSGMGNINGKGNPGGTKLDDGGGERPDGNGPNGQPPSMPAN